MRKLIILSLLAILAAGCSKQPSLVGTLWTDGATFLSFDSATVCRVGAGNETDGITYLLGKGTYSREGNHIEFSLRVNGIFYDTSWESAEIEGDNITVTCIDDPDNIFSHPKTKVLTKI